MAEAEDKQPFELPDFYVPWPARLNPSLEGARHTKAWARKVGILDPPPGEDRSQHLERSEARRDGLRVALRLHPPRGTRPRTRPHHRLVRLGLLFRRPLPRDLQAPSGSGRRQEIPRPAPLFMPVDLAATPPEPTNPVERGLADLWYRTVPSRSVAWRRRFSSTKNLLDESTWELSNISGQRVANPIEYIEMRRKVGGAPWSADLVEHAVFVEVPDRIAASRPMLVLRMPSPTPSTFVMTSSLTSVRSRRRASSPTRSS